MKFNFKNFKLGLEVGAGYIIGRTMMVPWAEYWLDQWNDWYEERKKSKR